MLDSNDAGPAITAGAPPRSTSKSIARTAIGTPRFSEIASTQAGALTLARSPATGQLVTATQGVVGSTWSYDAYGALESSTASVSGSAVFQETLTRDALARITGKVETVQGVTTNWTYAFDTAGRLQQVTKNGGSSGTYLFDANGNRISANGIAATFDAQDRELTSGMVQFKSDAFGSLVEKRDTANGALTQYQVDGNGGLRKATLPDNTVLDYLVDARGRRVGKKRNGILEKGWLYDGQLRIVAELDGSGAVTSRFVYGSLSHSPDYLVRAGVNYRFVHDSLGSVRLVINAATGAVAQRLDYDEWGVVLADSSPGFQPFGFAGGLTDGDTGLVRFGARDYAPALGRWTTKDPLLFEGGASNLYAYARNNPGAFIDPNGAWPINSDEYNSCWADCVSQSSMDAAWLTAFSAWPKRLLPPWRLPVPSQPLTTPISSIINQCGGAAGNGIGRWLRNASGRASEVATPVTIAEGFFDWGMMAACGVECSGQGTGWGWQLPTWH